MLIDSFFNLNSKLGSPLFFNCYPKMCLERILLLKKVFKCNIVCRSHTRGLNCFLLFYLNFKIDVVQWFWCDSWRRMGDLWWDPLYQRCWCMYMFYFVFMHVAFSSPDNWDNLLLKPELYYYLGYYLLYELSETILCNHSVPSNSNVVFFLHLKNVI